MYEQETKHEQIKIGGGAFAAFFKDLDGGGALWEGGQFQRGGGSGCWPFCDDSVEKNKSS